MKIKKLLSFVAACAMTVTATVGAMTASAADSYYNDDSEIEALFVFYALGDDDKYTSEDGIYVITRLVDSSSTNPIVFPAYYKGLPVDAGEFGANSRILYSAATYPDVPEFHDSIYTIKPCTATSRAKNTTLKTVTIEYTGSIALTLIQAAALENVYIYSETIDDSATTLTGTYLTTSTLYHVTNQGAADVLIAKGVPAENVLVDLEASVTTDERLEALNKAIENAEALNASDYTSSSYAKVTEALTVAKLITSDSTDDEIRVAKENLDTAVTGLITKVMIKSQLDEAIKNANAISSNLYSEETYAKVTEALTAAGAINDDSTIDEIETAVNNINEAIAGLEYRTEGQCGENATWRFDKDTGVLTISGTGDMYDSNSSYKMGWYGLVDFIKEVVIEEGITSVGDCAFGIWTAMSYTQAYPNLTKVTLPSTLKTIGDYAFCQSGLTSITLPEGLESIGTDAFSGTASKAAPLTGKLTLPSTLKEIGQSAFSCTSITSLSVNEGVTLGGQAFYICPSLKEVTINKNIKYLQTGTGNAMRTNNAFGDCKALEKVTVADGVTELSDNMFKGCTALKEVVFETKALTTVPKITDNGNVFDADNNITFKVYEDSKTETTLKNAGYLTSENTAYIPVPLDPFVNVYKNGAEAKVAALTADKAIAGTTKIKLTFDCASDVSYNPNASIEVKTVVNGTESYEKFIGTDGSYKNGTTDWTVELPLKSEIKSGDSVDITAFTYAWKNASKYVYAIKKVEFLDESGKVLGKVTAKTVAQDKLAEEIAKAEKTDTTNYTDESVAKLTKAIESAKALTDEATAEEINTALTAIKDAVKALTYKPADYTKVDEAIAKIPADLSKYTDESVKALNTAKEAVIRDKNITEQETVDGYAKAINDAISALKVKPTPTKPNTTNPTTKATRSKEAVKKDKSAAKKAMKQAKISKLKVKSKAKKKINVTWKKVKKAKGYQVQVSAKKNFKKVIFKKDLKKTKLTIKNKKIKSKKTYYVRVRAYATYKNTNNKTVKVYSKWNKKLRKVTVK